MSGAILNGSYNSAALVKCGATLVRDNGDGTIYVEPAGLDISGYDPNYTPVPQSVKLAQARKALIRSGLFSTVDTAIRSPGNEELLQDWEYGDVIRRDSMTVAALAAQLGITDTQLDDLFRLAATL